MNEIDVEEVFRDAAGAIDVPAPSVDAVVAESRAHRHHRQRQVLTSVGTAAAVLALATWWGTRPDPDPEGELPPAVVTRAENPADIAWWANDVLHLDHVDLALLAVTDLAEVAAGAVYADVRGAVVLVDEEGARTRLGTKAPGSRLVVSDEQRWVAWVDPNEGALELVVYDVTRREVLAQVSVPPGTDPIALDQDKVFYARPDGDFALVLPDGEAGVREGAGLLDVASATRVRQSSAEALMMVQPFFSISFGRPGVGAHLSADGNYVLTRTADERSVYGTVHIYDTRSGKGVPTGLTDEDLALAARFGPEGTVTYVVSRFQDEPQADDFVRSSFSGALELRTCSLDTGRCEVKAKLPSTGPTPVLGR